jgi:hypothetical protein
MPVVAARIYRYAAMKEYAISREKPRAVIACSVPPPQKIK